MSEYLNKQDVLEWLETEIQATSSNHDNLAESIRAVVGDLIAKIQSGAFDADESEGTWKATAEVLGRENAQMNSEIQRLREVLEKARQYIVNGYDLGYIDDREGYTEALVREIDKALSITSEPTCKCGGTGGYNIKFGQLGEETFPCEVCSADFFKPTGTQRVREVVAWFAQQMEAKLRENDHKGGWQDCSLDWLVERLYKEAKELWIEVDRVVPEPERIIREAADVANFAMMIADVARRINDSPELLKGEENE